MRRQPRLDIAATFRRQFVVDEGMQFIFGDGNRWIGHCRCLFLVEIIPVFFSSRLAGERKKDRLFANVSPKSAYMTLVIISPAATPGVRLPVKPSRELGRAQAETSRCRSARPGYRRPRGSSSLPASPKA